MRRAPLLCAVLAACLAVPAGAVAHRPAPGEVPVRGYGWPIEPFNEQHPIRGFFGDPRVADDGQSFHSGVDIVAPDGTPVYAVAGGTVHTQPDAVSIESGRRVIGYWHILPFVSSGETVRLHREIGIVARGWGHVHLSERIRGVWVNPLRRGGLRPYTDTTRPKVVSISIWSRGSAVNPERVEGAVDIVVNAYDTPSAPLPPAPWTLSRVTPEIIRWRVVRDGRPVLGWRTTIDFRRHLSAWLYPDIYAPGTTQNRAGHPGRYLFYAAREWPTIELPDGVYRLEVEALDTRGNRDRASMPLRIANPAL